MVMYKNKTDIHLKKTQKILQNQLTSASNKTDFDLRCYIIRRLSLFSAYKNGISASDILKEMQTQIQKTHHKTALLRILILYNGPTMKPSRISCSKYFIVAINAHSLSAFCLIYIYMYISFRIINS